MYLVDYPVYCILGYIQDPQAPANSFVVITEYCEAFFTTYYNSWKKYFFLVFLKMNVEVLLTYNEMENTEQWNHDLCGMQHTFFSKPKYKWEQFIIFLHWGMSRALLFLLTRVLIDCCITLQYSAKTYM